MSPQTNVGVSHFMLLFDRLYRCRLHLKSFFGRVASVRLLTAVLVGLKTSNKSYFFPVQKVQIKNLIITLTGKKQKLSQVISFTRSKK